ncbi:MAG: hypothetical protein OMM_06289 [Candidatus Magnetoglobus multicellularis str. Araruama]|uniref:DUF3492 domain-containing protein n=1 Tax=Candidatus Magnetoglobus multicellularis str. Araruama TaxID=890399 RepID=A0A1V1PHW6_9BACT|nr:MAG: hypothetical protein OMM_06289 [Candidatus Magnetoglobus multicellularis str. Araruama]
MQNFLKTQQQTRLPGADKPTKKNIDDIIELVELDDSEEDEIYDVCLILEGTYPFVAGGVSSWVHNLIRALSEFSFTGICILPTEKEKWEVKYDVPANFKGLKVVYLHDYDIGDRTKHKKNDIERI